jgi:MerR family transcriptional regulator, light-induced transcriptional regulator
LLAFARGWDRGLGPRALLACAPGEQHTFGLISFGVALHQRGWRITYLGADTSVAMVQEAATYVRPDLVVICAAMRERMTAIVAVLRPLSEQWPMAIAGGGTSLALAAQVPARHLDADPVTAAETVSLQG